MHNASAYLIRPFEEDASKMLGCCKLGRLACRVRACTAARGPLQLILKRDVSIILSLRKVPGFNKQIIVLTYIR